MHVFTYGSLMFPSVMEALTNTEFLFEDITLRGYERRALVEKKYPGVRENHHASVAGRLWFDLDQLSLEILNRFEDPLYERRTVAIESRSRGNLEALVYIVPSTLEHTMTETGWNEEHFRSEHLEQYVQMCRRFRENLINVER